MSKFDEFYTYAVGKVWDTYGNQSTSNVVQWDYPLAGQCVSLIKTYNKYLGYGLKAYGNAMDYWVNRKSNGILNICNEVSTPKNGDIVISAGDDPRYGHIFIYKDGQAFTQNCCNNPRATLYPLSYQGTIYGYLRPKCLVATYDPNQLISERNKAIFLKDSIIIRRDAPDGADTGKRFNTNNSVIYTEKWIGNGHRYISWVENSVRYFAAVSGSETPGVDPWARFEAIPDINVNVNPSDLISKEGVATLTTDIGVIARNGGPTGEKVRTYQPGAKVPFKWIWVGNGHRYIVWKEGASYIYLAVSGSETEGAEPWATFEYDIKDIPENPSEGTHKPTDKDPELEESEGTATFINDVPLIVRVGGPTGKDSGQRKNKSDTQKYSWLYTGNGHVYIVWSSGKDKLYCAVSGTETFDEDPWAILTPKGEELPDVNPSEPDDDDDYIDPEQPDLPVVKYIPTKGWLEKFGITVKYNLVSKEAYKYKCPFVIDPKGTITHNSGTPNDPDATNLNQSMLNSTTLQKSWHLTVDEDTIVQGISLNRNCWAAGDYSTGWNSKEFINIEICRDTLDEDNDKFLLAERNAAIVIADLMVQYNWSDDTITKHQDYSGKDCPHKTMQLGWDRYVNMILSYKKQLLDFINLDDSDDNNGSTTPSISTTGSLDLNKINSLVDSTKSFVESATVVSNCLGEALNRLLNK